jgi:hypothetical protein
MITEESFAIEQSIKAGTAPTEIVAGFNELSALRQELKKLGEPESYYLKAMNCPHHHRIFAAEPRSYRDLPLRLAEYGTCYRYEQSGELFGLMRVRSMNMNDAHIYCTEEQFAQEFNAVNEMYLKYFKIFGIEKYQMRFSTHDGGLGKKYVNEPELWKKTEDMVRKVLINSKINTSRCRTRRRSTGRRLTCRSGASSAANSRWRPTRWTSPCRQRFGLVYRDKDNTDKTPLCIHRAPLGTHERFIGFLIEHYAGNFPLWLAPEQVRVAHLERRRGAAGLRQTRHCGISNCARTCCRVDMADFSPPARPVQGEDCRTFSPRRGINCKSTRCWSSAGGATWNHAGAVSVVIRAALGLRQGAFATSARSRRPMKWWRTF